MPPRRAKKDCNASSSLINQTSSGDAYLDTPDTKVNTKPVESIQRQLRKRPPLPPPTVLSIEQSNGRRTNSRAKAKLESNAEEHHGTSLILDNEQSSKVSRSIRSSSRKIGHGLPIAPIQADPSTSKEKPSAKHLVSAQILASEENMFQKQTPQQRKFDASVVENAETPVTSIMTKNHGAVRFSTRNTRTPMAEVVKNCSIQSVRSSARIKKTGLQEEELKKSTTAMTKRNSTSEKLQPTTTKRAKKDCKASSDNDAVPTPCLPSNVKGGNLSTSKGLEIPSVQSDESKPKGEGSSQPIKKRGRRCISTKLIEPANKEENKDMQSPVAIKTVESVNDEELQKRAMDKVEAVPLPKRRRTTKASAKMIEETKHVKVTMDTTSSRDLQLGEDLHQSLRDVKDEDLHQSLREEVAINAKDGKNEPRFCNTSATKVSALAPNKRKKSVTKNATSRITTRANKNADSPSCLVDSLPMASVGKAETLMKSSDVIVIPTAMKKVDKKTSSRSTNRKKGSSISLVEDVMTSTKSSELTDITAAKMMPYSLDTFPMHELASHVDGDEIDPLSVKSLSQRTSKRTRGRKMVTKRTNLSKATEVSPVPSITEYDMNKEKTSVATDELNNAESANKILNFGMQTVLAMNENNKSQDENKKLDSVMQTRGKKGLTKKRPFPENVQKSKRLKKSAEVKAVSSPNLIHTATTVQVNDRASVEDKMPDWDANEITNLEECGQSNNVLKSRRPGKASSNKILAFDALPVGFGLGISGLLVSCERTITGSEDSSQTFEEEE